MDERKRLLSIALKLLSSRPRSSQEIKKRLELKSQNRNLINQIISELTTQKLIDDNKFARWYVESRSRSRPRSGMLLNRELKQIGINTDENKIEVDNFELAKSAYEIKKRLWEKLPPKIHKEKAARHLASRGFSWEIINKVLKLV